MIRPLYLLLYSILLFPLSMEGKEKTLSGLARIRSYSPWSLSPNPAATSYIPIDSLLEAEAGYEFVRNPLSLSDQPKEQQAYGASVDGFSRFDRLQLTGGLSWQQNRKEGVLYNKLTQPDYLITAGDTLGEPVRIEQYRIYGQAAYTLSPSFRIGIGGDYLATDNKDLTPHEYYEGGAHTTQVSTGILYDSRQLSLGVSAGYTHRTELLSYGIEQKERLYTYPMGYFLQMGDLNGGENGGILRSGAGGSYLFRSVGNQWELSLQTDWKQTGWDWFNNLTFSRQTQDDNPDKSGNMRGWEETFTAFRYQSRLTFNKGRWTHLLSPQVYFQKGISDRILQHPDLGALSEAWITYATHRLAGRTQMVANLQYESARDYTPTGEQQAWEAGIQWAHRKESIFTYPATISQITTTLQAAIAYRHTLTLSPVNRLLFRPSLLLQTGYGTEETISQPQGAPETTFKSSRSYFRVSNDFAARTTTRILYHLQAEYARRLSPTLSVGIRFYGGVEQIITAGRGTGGQGGITLYLNL